MKRSTKLKRNVDKSFAQLRNVIAEMQMSVGTGIDIDGYLRRIDDAVKDVELVVRAYEGYRRCQWCQFRVEKEPRVNRWIFPGLKEDGPCSKGHSPELLKESVIGSLGVLYHVKKGCPDFKRERGG